MLFKRLVEVGRVVVVGYGEDSGKLAVITDIVDHNRAIVDGPDSGVRRQALAFKRMNLTPLTISIPRGARSKTVKKALKAAGTEEAWNKTAWAKKLNSRKQQAAMTDLDRFKVAQAKKQRKIIVAKATKKSKPVKKSK